MINPLSIIALKEETLASGLFDARWYAARYRDVAETGLSPLSHFVQFGMLLDRDPGPAFNVRNYILANPASSTAGIPAFLHYLREGGHANAPSLLPLRFQPKGAASGSVWLTLTAASFVNFQLLLRGWAMDRSRPGLPLRIDCTIGDQPPVILLAHGTPQEHEADEAPDGALFFAATLEVPESQSVADVVLRVIGTEVELAVPFAREAAQATRPQLVPVDPKRRAATEDRIIGSIDQASFTAVTGWAQYSGPNDPVSPDLILSVDGRTYSQTRCTGMRVDVKEVHGGDGYSGYAFEIAPNLVAAGEVSVSVKSASGDSRINPKSRVIKLPGMHMPAVMAAPSRQITAQASMPSGRKISMIILNRNGAGILRDMLQSAERVGEAQSYEWLVLDHQSTDESEAVCAEARDRGFDIRFINRKGNFSFSESNNYGAELASGDILIFANNDLIFREPVAPRILEGLRDERIGLIGVKLLDHVDDPAWQDQLPVQHLGVFMKPAVEGGWLRPYESRQTTELPDLSATLVEQPAVTGAFFAMRRADFEAVGGFDEGYSYGLEDVDLCFKVKARLGKMIACDNALEIIHHRGFSRGKERNVLRHRRNNDRFNQIWGSWLRDNIRSEVLTRPGFWTGARPVLGFIVTEADDNTAAGDYFTAVELGVAMQKILPVHLRFLGKEDWQDLTGIDILIVMVNNFNITKAKSVNPYLVTINWTRQWFDRWAKDPTIHSYDQVWASSQRAADYLAAETGRPVDVLPIATNYGVFSAGTRQKQYECDWCFTGSYFNVAREVQFQLDPSSIQGKGIVYGHNWEGTPFESISVGPVPYSQMPDIYASTKIVIDDANIATKPWGSCNSRVFDALAAGCLLVTNGDLGVNELFGDLIPTYHDRESLTQVLNYWLEHEDERLERVAQLQQIVAKHHSYDARARAAATLLHQRPTTLRIAIKCAAPLNQTAQWGDFYFAESLAASLRRSGAIVRVDCREQWASGIAETDDVVIVLRGLLPYKPRRHQKNIMWLISHPDDVPLAELQEYDQVFVASAPHARILASQTRTPVGFLPQCTDTERFRFVPELVNQRSDRALFVGNSRGEFRDSVRWSVEHALDIDIYGGGWEPFITDKRLKGNVVPNRILGGLYASSRLVLCDHWQDMREKGYVSNRVFDVLAVGGRLVVDEVAEMADLIPSNAYEVFRNAEELAEIVNRPGDFDIEERARLAEWVKEHHSFDARARQLYACCETLCQKLG